MSITIGQIELGIFIKYEFHYTWIILIGSVWIQQIRYLQFKKEVTWWWDGEWITDIKYSKWNISNQITLLLLQPHYEWCSMFHIFHCLGHVFIYQWEMSSIQNIQRNIMKILCVGTGYTLYFSIIRIIINTSLVETNPFYYIWKYAFTLWF